MGVGRYVPLKEVTNAQVEEWTGLPAGTIETKTGVRSRFIAADDETASGMSAAAAREAIAMAGIAPEAIGMVLCCSFTGDYVYPPMACRVQEMVGARNAGAFDLMANCTGFQIGLDVMANRMMADRGIQYGLVIGTALQSRFINWKDADSAMYFGDGAGAAILGRVPEGYGLLATEIFTNPAVFDSVRLRGGGSSHPMRAENIGENLQYYEIDGMEVWKQVVRFQPKVVRQVLEKIGKTTDDVNFFIFHQANLRLIEFLMGKMKQPMTKTMTNVAEIGNTADASIAIALNDAVRAGKLKRDDLVVISGVGAGFTFGASVFRWY